MVTRLAPSPIPIGSPAADLAERRRRHSDAYRPVGARLATFRAIAGTVIVARGAKGWTQRHLAYEIGTTDTVISRIESGRHAVSVDTLLRLSAALDVTFTIEARVLSAAS